MILSRVLPRATLLTTRGLSGLTTTMTTPDDVSYITLNNPARRNPLSLDMLNSLISDIESANSHSRCIVIRSTGNVFSSGHDLKELAAASQEVQYSIFNRCNDLMLLVAKSSAPILASVDGFATAAGCQLVAACHVAICSERSKFATPGVNIGLFCSTPGVQLGRAVNRKLAMDMLLTGEPISSEAALRGGLVSRVFESSEELQSETERIASLIASKSSPVVKLGISNFNSQMRKPLVDAAEQSSEVMVRNLELEDGKEGLNAFLEKRHPSWQQDK